MTTPLQQTPPDEIELLETRLAAQLAAALRVAAEAPPPDVAERLRFGREQALARARRERASGAAPFMAGGGLAVLGRLGPWWPRLGALLPALVLAAGVVWVAQEAQREQLSVAAEIDTALLADDLPPAAYADPGFVAFLKLEQP